MDAHLRYFKLGYDLLSQMEPFIHQVLTYAQQSKEQANKEQDRLAKRIQEFRTEEELNHLRAASNREASTTHVSANGVGMSSNKNIEEIMQSTAKGKVQTIKQGYLLKQSSSLRADWKRRFFVLDSHGALCYHRPNGNKSAGSPSIHSSTSTDHHNRVFGRFRTRHQQISSFGEQNLGCRTVDLRTSTIKIDADDADLRLCFRIISPLKTYTLQAENVSDRIDWMNKITGVIASLLNSHLQQLHPGASDMDHNIAAVVSLNSDEALADNVKINPADYVSRMLREIPGNDICAECSAPEPEWASLNLGILICIECSGVHRNLGVHISKVRSITLDVKVWEPTIIDLFRALGNSYCNSIWEGLVQSHDENRNLSAVKPSPKDAIHQKEKYILQKYVEKSMVSKEATSSGVPSYEAIIWEAVQNSNLREVYHLIVTSHTNIVITIYDEVNGINLHHSVHEHDSQSKDPSACEKLKDSIQPANCLQGCSLLHLACHTGNAVMVELLLQFGADINKCDFHGRTPLHHCICAGNNKLAKVLLRRGANTSIKDGGGLGALDRAMEAGAITDGSSLSCLENTNELTYIGMFQ